MLHRYVPEAVYRVSDTYRIRIRVRYAQDTYPRSIRFFIIFVQIGYAIRHVSGLPIWPSPVRSPGRQNLIPLPRRPSVRCPQSRTAVPATSAASPRSEAATPVAGRRSPTPTFDGNACHRGLVDPVLALRRRKRGAFA